MRPSFGGIARQDLETWPMDKVNRVLGRARAWHGFVTFVRCLFIWLTGGTGALVALGVLERLLGFAVEWSTVVWLALGACFAFAALTALVLRRSRFDIARLLDDRIGLREALSTAVCVEGDSDPWSRAAVAQASDAARRVIVRQALPLSVPRIWPAPFVLFGAFLLTGLLPRFDLFHWARQADASQRVREENRVAREEVKFVQDKLKEVLAKIDDPVLKEGEQSARREPANAASAEQVRLEAVKQLTSVQDRLAELKNGEKAAAFDELRKKLRSLKSAGTGPLDALTKAMQQGKFEEASKEMERLSTQLASGELTDEQKAQLQAQLQSLAKQLANAAEQQRELESRLKQLGLDPKLAGDPAAMKRAMVQMKGLPPEQKQALQRMAEAAEAASKQCKGLGEAAEAAVGQLAQDGKLGVAGLAEMGEQLSALELAQQEMNAIDAAQAQAMAQLADLSKKLGRSDSDCEGGMDPMAMMRIQEKWGSGRGAGGVGGSQPSQEAGFRTKDSKASTKTQAGPIIGSSLVQGEQVRGEAVQQFEQAMEAGGNAAAEAIESKQVPREYQDAVRHYFGKLKSKAPTAPAGGNPAAAPLPAAPPAKEPAPAPAGENGKKKDDAGDQRPSR